ncbi:MAG: hypothetical protein RLZZ77_1471 [Bacteroidota bacterium]
MNRLLHRLFFSALLICSSFAVNGQSTIISGTISDLANGEPLGYALVYIPGTAVGVSSNDYGYYSLSIDPSFFKSDSLIIEIKMIGYPVKAIGIKKGKSQTFDISLSADGESLKTIEIIADAGQKERVSSTQMSAFRIPMKDIKKMPGLLGETDIIKIVQLMPGVQKGGEGGTGMFVRGGTADQNLVLLDEATVYNIGHLFGFFSVFNQDALHDMTMIKGAFPSEYGGRLSSILDITMKEGDLNKINVAGGVGLLSSRLTIDGPIKKEKASFLISARRTYIDKLFQVVGGFLPYYFYDFNAKANWKISPKDRIFFSSYIGKDILAFDSNDVQTNDIFGFGFELGNMTNTIRWNRIHSSKLFTNVSLIHTKFNYDIGGKFDNNNVLIKSDVRDISVKSSVDYYWTPDLKLTAGFQQIGHIFKPNVVSTSGEISTFLQSQKGTPLYSQEFSFYKGAEMTLKDGLLKLNLGIRTSGAFVPNQTYAGLEPRWSARYLLNEFSSLKFGYSRMKQYMHLVSSSSVSLPTDLWYPVTADVLPQRSDQFVLAWHSLLKKWRVNTEVEVYYKHMNNLIEYREGTNLILNNNFEEELVQGSGDSWGVEFLAQRQEGRITGWIGYTLSWATRQFDELNQGRTFWAKYDRRHNLSVVCNITLSKRWDFSAVWVYSSGSRFTPQIGQYFVPNASFTGVETIPVYTERNAVSMSPSHRLDINFVLKPRPNKKKKLSSEWHFGAYNFYNRATPYRIEIVPATTGLGYQYQQPGLFGFIPSIAYNFQF